MDDQKGPAYGSSRYISESVSNNKQTKDRHRLRDAAAASLSRFRPKMSFTGKITERRLFSNSRPIREKVKQCRLHVKHGENADILNLRGNALEKAKLARASKNHHG